ncbi:hypothetical protein ACLMJK_009089 [Lecanora helva]
MDPSSDLVEHFKLSAEFLPNLVQHISYRGDRSQGRRRVEVIERWKKGQILGVGGFGTVRLEVEDDGSKRAVKEISRWRCSASNIDYKKELATMAILSRHNDLFVEFFGWFENTETIYIAMEYFELGELQRYIHEEIPEQEVKNIVVQLLEGLKIMHQHGFTHRDLKPQNIFVAARRDDWWVKIGDFGITKRILNDETFLQTEVGTREYLAPEVRGYAGDDMANYTNAVDIWSLGCICHRLLTHRSPFANLKAIMPQDLTAYYNGQFKLPIEKQDEINISVEAVSFVKALLAPQAPARWTAELAMRSPWLKEVAANEVDSSTTIETASKSSRQSFSAADHNSINKGLRQIQHISNQSSENEDLRSKKIQSQAEQRPLKRSERVSFPEAAAVPSRDFSKHIPPAPPTPPTKRLPLRRQQVRQTRFNEKAVRLQGKSPPSDNDRIRARLQVMPETAAKILENLRVYRDGFVYVRGLSIGRLVEGNVEEIAGRSCDKEGHIRGEQNEIVGRCIAIPKDELKFELFSPFPGLNLRGCIVTEDGMVANGEGEIVATVSEGNPANIRGGLVKVNGDVVNEHYDVIGHLERHTARDLEVAPFSLNGKGVKKRFNLALSAPEIIKHVDKKILEAIRADSTADYNNGGKKSKQIERSDIPRRWEECGPKPKGEKERITTPMTPSRELALDRNSCKKVWEAKSNQLLCNIAPDLQSAKVGKKPGTDADAKEKRFALALDPEWRVHMSERDFDQTVGENGRITQQV